MSRALYQQAYQEREDSISDVTSSPDQDPVGVSSRAESPTPIRAISRANSREIARVPSHEQDLLFENNHVITRIRPSGLKSRSVYWPICGG
jgi:hypothetical protein